MGQFSWQEGSFGDGSTHGFWCVARFNKVGTMKRIFALALLGLASQVFAKNYATCVLENLPGSSNEATTSAVVSMCRDKFPLTLSSIEKGSGRGLFSHSNGNACVLKKAKDTSNQRAAFLISTACRCLFDEATFNGEKCWYPPNDPNSLLNQ